MSNPLDRHLETLRGADPRPEAVDRAVASLRRSHPPRLVPLTAGVAALSAILLWPRSGNGYAWAQIAAQSLPLRYYEKTVVVSGKSRVTRFESWVDRSVDASRTRNALLIKSPNPGQASGFLPTRIDEKIQSRAGLYLRSGRIARFTRKTQVRGSFDLQNMNGRKNRLQGLLEDKGLRQLGIDRNVETRVGKADRYRLDMPAQVWNPATKRYEEQGRQPYVVYVQSGTTRVLGYDVVEAKEEWQTTIQYPDRFPKDTFAIPQQPGVRVYDLDALNTRVAARLKTPIATLRAGGQTSVLRLVAQDERNELWVLWSGGRPNGDLKDHARVLGMPNGARHGSMLLESKGFNGVFSRFGGHSVGLDHRVDRVDLKIPVFIPGPGRSRFVGDATVRGVSVLHLPFVVGLEEVDRTETGTRRPFAGTSPRPAP